MTDWPADTAVPITIWTGSKYGMGLGTRDISASTGAWASTAWGTANLAQFVPVTIPFRYPLRKMFVANAATLGGNLDVGIYSEDLTKIYSSGSVAQTGTSTMQFLPAAGTADLILEPGLYYLALASSSTTATYFTQPIGTVTRERYFGMFEQLSALPLPATATVAAVATAARIPLIGITMLPSPAF